MATFRVQTNNGHTFTVNAPSTRTADIVRAVKPRLSDVKKAVFQPIFGSSVARYTLHNKAGEIIGAATYLAPVGGR